MALAAAGGRSRRNLVALGLAVAGVGLLTELRLVGEPLGFGYAFANLGLFVCYLVFAHRIANHRAASRWGGIDQLGAAMLVAAVVATPFGIGAGSGALVEPGWLLAGAGVGICSSVVPYVLDQVVMARMPRATFALLLSLLPAWATIIGAVVLGQRPTAQDLAGVALVAVAVALHQR
ncbi:MAG: EamA family transporter [Natronosporangium sp.]